MKVALSKHYCGEFMYILGIERPAASQPHLDCALSGDMNTREAGRYGCGIVCDHQIAGVEELDPRRARQMAVAIHRLRKRYRELFRQEIADTVADPVEVESELRYLAAVLTRK